MPFYVTGVDYADPFLIKDRKGRESKACKCYICLFICFAVKATHLELISDMTVEAFIAALRRFSSRRSKPAHIYSDNSSDFVGANREVSELGNLLKKEETSARQSMTWELIGISFPLTPILAPYGS